jgi:diketogulonate reductase-like aldo/keto reductase
MKNAKLNNGVEMPYVGLGVFRLEDAAEAQRVVEMALAAGYRHIDTAAIYRNEAAVGQAIKNSGVARKDLFVTTKLWNEDQRSGRVEEAFELSLNKLGLDYVDLYLIHWPVAEKFAEAWTKMEAIYASGRAKAIGVSNFKKHHLETLKMTQKVTPAVNQIELHPYLIQAEDLAYCQTEGIQVEAWSPFAANKTGLLDEAVLRQLGEKHRKSPAQVILRWNYQRGVVIIPKSANAGRLQENLDIFDFELSQSDIEAINALNQNRRVGSDPDNFNF